MNENIILPVILAGGKSNRFGKDKSIVKLGNRTLLEHTIVKLEKEFSEILIVSNNSKLSIKKNNINIIKDCIDGQLGPLVGVLSSMKWVINNNKNYKWVATFPCDTPFFDIRIIKEFKKNSNLTKDLLYFVNSNKQRHNIFGLWSVKLCQTLEKDIKLKNFRKVEEWADKIGVKTIDITHEKFDKFLNINTQEEYKIAEKNLDKLNND
tara:strand:+ start:177 stop:800 length:624 start_codon:yes stop_codon:yes gene_type:complete